MHKKDDWQLIYWLALLLLAFASLLLFKVFSYDFFGNEDIRIEIPFDADTKAYDLSQSYIIKNYCR